MSKILTLVLLITLLSCQDKSSTSSSKTLWIYTSLYKDTINELTPELKKEFPGVEFKFFQAGSEEIATKVNAEMMSGNVQADVMISSDRFWYEELELAGKLYQYSSPLAKEVPAL